MKKKPHWFYSDLYYFNFYFCPNWKREELEAHFGFEISPSDGQAILTDVGVIIWIRDAKHIGCLVHECVHAANFLFRAKGIKASNKNDEPMAYLTQWIFDNCYKKLRK